MPEAPQVVSFPGPIEAGAEPEPADTAAMRVPGSAVMERILEPALTAGMRLSGSIAATRTTMSVATSQGLFLHHPSDLLHAQFRVYSSDGRSSGFGEHFASGLDEQRILRTVSDAVDKCAAWKNPIELKPSRITTVFEPRALADMFAPFLQQFSHRAIDEDRSFLRKLDGSTFIGAKMFKESVTLTSDPLAEGVLSLPFTMEGLPVRKETWVDSGVIEQVAVDRFAAMQTGSSPIALPTNFMMLGGEQSMLDLITGTQRGLLVTGFAELQVIDPKNCLLSGSTRDGLFLIEDGKISRAVRNLLIRETPVYLLKELEEIGIPEPTSTTGVYFPMRLPPLRVKDVLYGASSGLI